MRHPLMPLLLFVFCTPALAVTKYGHGEGGSLRPYTGRSQSIRLIRENIRITFSPDSTKYDVLTDYLFINEGANCMAQMFIPVSTGGLDDNKSDLGGLRITADGSHMPAKREVLRSPVESSGFFYDVKWITKVAFKSQQKRHVRVRYRSNLAGSCGESLFYILAGNRWRGRVGETKLLLVSASAKEERSASYSRGGEHSKGIRFDRKHNNAYSRWRNWNPAGAFHAY